jgi:hypothetical protein
MEWIACAGWGDGHRWELFDRNKYSLGRVMRLNSSRFDAFIHARIPSDDIDKSFSSMSQAGKWVTEQVKLRGKQG